MARTDIKKLLPLGEGVLRMVQRAQSCDAGAVADFIRTTRITVDNPVVYGEIISALTGRDLWSFDSLDEMISILSAQK